MCDVAILNYKNEVTLTSICPHYQVSQPSSLPPLALQYSSSWYQLQLIHCQQSNRCKNYRYYLWQSPLSKISEEVHLPKSISGMSNSESIHSSIKSFSIHIFNAIFMLSNFNFLESSTCIPQIISSSKKVLECYIP